jgi:hypothetical protein
MYCRQIVSSFKCKAEFTLVKCNSSKNYHNFLWLSRIDKQFAPFDFSSNSILENVLELYLKIFRFLCETSWSIAVLSFTFENLVSLETLYRDT